jgi:enamine deaminase RidA (YjgF/YER057c/UK114 family)
MNGTVEARLKEHGIMLPQVSAPAANYVPYTVSGNLAVISGQLPMQEGTPQFIGRIGKEFGIEEGQDCARLCALNVLAHLRNACAGDLGRVRRVLRLGVFVSATPEFTDHPKIANGASDLMVAVFGAEAGAHARAAVGVGGLPFGVAVEVEGLFEIA